MYATPLKLLRGSSGLCDLPVEVVFAVLERSFSRYEGRFRGKRPGISRLGIF